MAFEGIPIIVTYKHDAIGGDPVTERIQATEEITLPMPNGNNGFEYSVVDEGSNIYSDLNKFLRKGTAYKRVLLSLNYSSHNIHLNKLLIADKIEFDLSDFDLPFTNKDFKLNTDNIKRNWMSNYVISSSGTGLGTYEDLNPVPSGQASLEFISINIYNPS